MLKINRDLPNLYYATQVSKVIEINGEKSH